MINKMRKCFFVAAFLIIFLVLSSITGCSSKGNVSDYDFNDITISLNGEYSMLSKDELQREDDQSLVSLDLSENEMYDYMLYDQTFIRFDAGAVIGVYCLSTDSEISSVFDYARFVKNEETDISMYDNFSSKEVTVNDCEALQIVCSELAVTSYRYIVSTAFSLNDNIYVFRTETLDDKSGEMILDYYETVLDGVTFDGVTDDIDTFETVINWNEASDYIGDEVTVKGKMMSGGIFEDEPGCPIYIDLGEPYPSDNRFTIVIWEEYHDQFDSSKLPIEGDIVYVTGIIEKYKDIYQIEATDESQIEVE